MELITKYKYYEIGNDSKELSEFFSKMESNSIMWEKLKYHNVHNKLGDMLDHLLYYGYIKQKKIYDITYYNFVSIQNLGLFGKNKLLTGTIFPISDDYYILYINKGNIYLMDQIDDVIWLFDFLNNFSDNNKIMKITSENTIISKLQKRAINGS